MSGFDDEHAELLGALRGETCDDASRGRMRDKLAAAGVLSAAATAGTAVTAVAHAAPAKAGLLKLLTAGKLLGGGALLVAGTVVVVSLSSPSERSAPPPVVVSPSAAEPPAVAPPPSTQAAPSSPPEVTPAKALESKTEAEVERTAPPRKHTRAGVRTKETLAQETALLTSAARRLHAGDLEGAMRLLDEHERTFPDGVLRTERELARQRVQSELHGAP